MASELRDSPHPFSQIVPMLAKSFIQFHNTKDSKQKPNTSFPFPSFQLLLLVLSRPAKGRVQQTYHDSRPLLVHLLLNFQTSGKGIQSSDEIRLVEQRSCF